jgi:hypothetical protein
LAHILSSITDAIPNGFVWGFLGALAANCLRLFSFVGQRTPQRDAILGDPIYKAEFIILPFIGGIVAAAYGDAAHTLPHILPFHLGLSAPAIIKLGTGSVSHGKEPTS